MLHSSDILKCFENILIRDLNEYNIPPEAIQLAIESMNQVYKPNIAILNCARPIVANFNDFAHRCAYLHKYAAFHTAMVKDLFYEAIVENYDFFREWVNFYSQNNFKICSLGGGPGSDVIGSLAALGSAFGYFPASADIIDYMIDWQFSFLSVLRELCNGWYEPFGNHLYYLNWAYIGANLLQPLTNEVIDSISQASLVTMIKFASAAACQDTEIMIGKIFASMTPGAIVLFIDNDGGGYHKLVYEAAKKYGFCSMHGPHRKKSYTNELMKLKKFGYLSCYKSTVTIHILQKSYQNMVYSESIGNPNTRVIINNPILPSSPTPILFCPDADFTRDKNFEHENFSLPEHRIPQSHDVNAPFAKNIIYETTPQACISKKRKCRKIKNKTQGCFPVKNFRHHLANIFRKKKNPSIFRL